MRRLFLPFLLCFCVVQPAYASSDSNALMEPALSFNKQAQAGLSSPLKGLQHADESCITKLWRSTYTQRLYRLKGKKSKLAWQDAAITAQLNSLGSHFLSLRFDLLMSAYYQLDALRLTDPVLKDGAAAQSALIMNLTYTRAKKINACHFMKVFRHGPWSQHGQQMALAKERGYSAKDNLEQQRLIDLRLTDISLAAERLRELGIDEAQIERWSRFPYYSMFASLGF
jgi:hypothetical protein